MNRHAEGDIKQKQHYKGFRRFQRGFRRFKKVSGGFRGEQRDRGQSMSYPFFSDYGRDEAFPQDTDLSPVPFY